jgi:hypothetical protein
MPAPPDSAASWRRYLKTLLAVGLGAGGLIYAFLLVVDGYDTVWFAPGFDREPVTSNQRFSFPALARKAKFDSAIIGTSTARLLRPEALDPLLGARFVNLAMNDATAWEEAEIFQVFRRHHSNPKAVILGLDRVWCEAGADFRRLTPRPFPDWMYDDDKWNDLLHLFNLPALEETGRQAAYLLGWRRAKYGKDGFTAFLPPQSAYDLARARFHIYGPGGPAPVIAATPPAVLTEAEARAINFPMHGLMNGIMRNLPAGTVKILLVLPYHVFHQPRPGSRDWAEWGECKRRIAALAATLSNAHVLDFMIDSDLTRRDENYWDPLHYNEAVAQVLTQAIGDAVAFRPDRQGLYRHIGPSR